MIIFFYGGFIVSSDKMKKSYWFFSVQWLVLSYTNVGCFYLQKGVLSNIIHFTAVVNQTFPFYIKVGSASYILSQSKKTNKTYIQLLVFVCWLIVVNMARQADLLVKIGQEGFAAIDEHFARARSRRPPVMKVPYTHPTYYYATEVIDSNEAAQRYKGRVYVDYPKGKPVPF